MLATLQSERGGDLMAAGRKFLFCVASLDATVDRMSFQALTNSGLPNEET